MLTEAMVRRLLGLTLLMLLAGLAGCEAIEPLPGDVNIEHWRTAQGDRITAAEFAALRESCRPRIHDAAIDPWGPVTGPQSANPAYHPGGEGPLGAPPTGIARLDAPVAVAATRTASPLVPWPIEECLESKGLVHRP